MNRLTAVFLQELYTYAPQKQELLQRAKQELIRELEHTMAELISPSTVFGSVRGQELRQNIADWKQKVKQCTNMEDVSLLQTDLEKLKEKERQLRKETQSELQKSGFVDSARLHLFYFSEQKSALQILNEVIHVELFRIAVLTGARQFAKIPALASVPDSLSDRLIYYKNYLIPVLQSKDNRDLYGCWAFRFQENGHVGPLGNLPGYLITEPNLSKAEKLLPGEYTLLENPHGILYQGIGYLTNITPDTVEFVQRGQIKTYIPVAELAVYLYQNNPIRALESYFGSTPYLVDPYELFATANMAQEGRAMVARGRERKCFLCGQPVQNNTPLCSACAGKVCIP